MGDHLPSMGKALDSINSTTEKRDRDRQIGKQTEGERESQCSKKSSYSTGIKRVTVNFNTIHTITPNFHVQVKKP